MAYETVLVDLDDTLYPYPECNEAGKAAAFRAARELGYDVDREAFEALYQAARRDVKRDLAGAAASHERFLYFKRAVEMQAGTLDAADALALGEAYWSTYVETMEPFDGAVETLAALKEAGLDVAVVTNLTARIQMKKIAHLGIGEHVDLVVTSEETGQEKPASVMFTLPLARLDTTPDEALMVGDSARADVAGANAMGLTSVLCNEDPDGLEGQRRPDHHVETFPGVREVAL